jgi:ASC-1-like (ASCH) protein
MDHIVELRRDQITMILRGQKSIEPKFMKEDKPPYNAVSEDDTIYFQLKDGYAVAKANVSKVENFDNLTPDKVVSLIEENKEALCPNERLVEKACKSSYGTFVWLNQLQEIRPFRVKKKQDEDTNWMIVEDVNKIRML